MHTHLLLVLVKLKNLCHLSTNLSLPNCKAGSQAEGQSSSATFGVGRSSEPCQMFCAEQLGILGRGCRGGSGQPSVRGFPYLNLGLPTSSLRRVDGLPPHCYDACIPNRCAADVLSAPITSSKKDAVVRLPRQMQCSHCLPPRGQSGSRHLQPL